MKKSEVVLASLCGLFLGMVIGFLIAPIKKGIEFGNNSGNTTSNYYGKEEEEDD
jgi:hypothetical protein